MSMMDNILIRPKTKKQFDQLTQVLKALGVSFQIEKPHFEELDKLINQTESDIKSGRTKKIKTSDLWK
jgi:hypothetical protein